MEKEENKRAIVVGIFIALGIIIFLVGIFNLGGQQSVFKKNFHITAVFDDVQGLKKGNNVWFSGVKVGTISDVKFIGLNQVSVQMVVDDNVQQFIHSNTGVKIGSDGLIGNKIIVIDGGTADAPVIADGATVQVQKEMSTADMMKTLQKNNENLLVITSDFKKLSNNIVQGKGLVGELMADSAMAIKFRSIVNNLNATTASTQQMAIQMTHFTDKLNTKGGLTDKLLTDTAVFNQLKASVAQLKQATNTAGALADNLNKAGADLSKATHKLNTTDNAIGVLLNDPKGAEQVRSTLNYLQQSTIKLNDDLEAAQHNFLLKGFFKDKAKKEAKAKAEAGTTTTGP